jgi:hypothetical protein
VAAAFLTTFAPGSPQCAAQNGSGPCMRGRGIFKIASDATIVLEYNRADFSTPAVNSALIFSIKSSRRHADAGG